MSNVYPTLRRLDRNSACTVLDLCDSVVLSGRNNNFLCADYRIVDILAQTEAYTAAGACLNEIVLRTCIESILSVNKFGVKNYVSLLGRF